MESTFNGVDGIQSRHLIPPSKTPSSRNVFHLVDLLTIDSTPQKSQAVTKAIDYSLSFMIRPF